MNQLSLRSLTASYGIGKTFAFFGALIGVVIFCALPATSHAWTKDAHGTHGTKNVSVTTKDVLVWGSPFTVGQSATCPSGSVMVHAYATYSSSGAFPLIAKQCRSISAPGLTFGTPFTVGQSATCPAGSVMTHAYYSYVGGVPNIIKQCTSLSAPGITWGGTFTVNQFSVCPNGSAMIHAYPTYVGANNYYTVKVCQWLSVMQSCNV